MGAVTGGGESNGSAAFHGGDPAGAHLKRIESQTLFPIMSINHNDLRPASPLRGVHPFTDMSEALSLKRKAGYGKGICIRSLQQRKGR